MVRTFDFGETDEIAACTPYLDRQIQILRPKIIIPLGRHSARYIFSKVNEGFTRISNIRGQLYREQLFNLSVIIMPTYHPAATLYSPKYKTVMKDDFKKIKSEVTSFTY